MKNRLSLIILILYTILLIIFSFNNEFIDNINLSVVSLLSLNDPNKVFNILEYIEKILFFMGYGICTTIVCIEYFDAFKYIVIYSILLSIFAIIINLLIKSFYMTIELSGFITMLIGVIAGIIIEMLVKIKQIKGGKYEE